MSDKKILDSNAVLRYLLEDNAEQFAQIKQTVRANNCIVPLEVVAEVVYVLEGLYKVPRGEIVSILTSFTKDVLVVNADVFLRGLEIFDQSPKLDFVDCLMYGYKVARGYDVMTFDQKLLRRLSEVK